MKTDSYLTPTNIRVTQVDSTLTIRIPWFYQRYAVAFFIIPIVLLFMFYHIQNDQDSDPWPLFYILSPFLLAQYYFLLTKFVNYTEIFIDEKNLEVRHKPLPFRKGLCVDCSDISDIVVNERIYPSRSRRKYFEICVVKNQKSYPVATYIEDFDQATQIQNHLRSFFNISKRVGPGVIQ